MNAPKKPAAKPKKKYRKTKEEINAEGRERKREKNIVVINLVAVTKNLLLTMLKVGYLPPQTRVLVAKNRFH